jgi:energy-coupling factor transporter ATP-binding protein EcfA2
LNNYQDLPDFKVEQDKIPEIRVKSIHFQNFKAFEDAKFDFTNNDSCKKFICFFGNNGCGKSTILDTLQLIFSRFEGRTDEKTKALLGKLVRHTDGKQNGVYGNDDFLITAQIHSSLGDYEVQINKSGFIKDHPEEVKMIVYRLFFYARFDQELNQFQLARSKWDTFKELFEAVTGFKVEEQTGLFDESEDPVQADILRQYVLGFLVHKPDEIITHKECSAGERKIIKSFSTLLNKEYMPSIVCVDNAEMHVEAGRHIQLIQSMKKCFPNSQIFATTHSYQISRNFGERNQLYDLRLLKESSIIKEQPWRLYIADELKDAISKLKSFTIKRNIVDISIAQGDTLVKKCFDPLVTEHEIVTKSRIFLQRIAQLFLEDMLSYYKRK